MGLVFYQAPTIKCLHFAIMILALGGTLIREYTRGRTNIRDISWQTTATNSTHGLSLLQVLTLPRRGELVCESWQVQLSIECFHAEFQSLSDSSAHNIIGDAEISLMSLSQ